MSFEIGDIVKYNYIIKDSNSERLHSGLHSGLGIILVNRVMNLLTGASHSIKSVHIVKKIRVDDLTVKEKAIYYAIFTNKKPKIQITIADVCHDMEFEL